MDSPLFSIITPTYNSLSHLKKCIESVSEQSFSSYEHIIIDDGSNDETLDFLTKNKKSNQVLIFSKHSGLPGIVRNIGLKKAKGLYVSFLDADDLFQKDKLFLLYKEIEEGNPDILYHNEIEKYKNNKFLMRYPSKNFISKKNFIKFGNRFSTSTITIRKEFINKNSLLFSEENEHKIVEDYHFWMRILHFNPKIKKIKKYLSVYTIHKKGISNNKEKLYINENNCINDLYRKSFLNKKQLKFADIRIKFNVLLLDKKKNIFKILGLWFCKDNFFTISKIVINRIFEIFLKKLNIF